MVAQSRNIVLENLTPGTVSDFQVRAIGGSTGRSLWSGRVSQMATWFFGSGVWGLESGFWEVITRRGKVLCSGGLCRCF